MKPPVLLRIFLGDDLKEVKQFTDKQVVIGRNSDAQLKIDDNEVSPLHALIEERDSGYFVSDLGSESGTFRNGERILDEKIESGDEIKVGPYRIVFFVGVPKPVDVPPPVPPQTVITQVGDALSGKAAEEPPVVAEPPKEEPPKEEPPKAEPPKPEPPKVEVAPVVKAATIPQSGPGTYAPGSVHKNLDDVIRPDKGTTVEVIVAWKERIVGSYHYNDKKTVVIGSSPKCDIVMPLVGFSKAEHPIVKIDSMATVALTREMAGELITESGRTSFSELAKQGKMTGGGDSIELQIPQGEMVRVDFAGSTMSLYVRYVPEAPKPLVAPFLDLTASEVTGIVLAMVVAAIFGLYMMVYSPMTLEDEARVEEPLRKATVTFKMPKKKIVRPTDGASKAKKKVVKVDATKKKVKRAARTTKPKKQPGKASEVAPKKTKSKKKVYTSARRKGGAPKTGKTGSNMKSQKVDPSKVGLLGVFGSKGTQQKIDKTYSGQGELIGMAQGKTGGAGDKTGRPGVGIGSKLKNDGAGGKGTSTVGISGVGTRGKGTGGYGYGTGGLGKKGSIEVNVDGVEAAFEGSIDREAIRRVIRANRRAIRTCYERQLNRNPDLYGKLVLEWDIGERGRVSGARVKSNSLGNKQVAKCIIGRLKTWKFPSPPPDQVARVTYPFVFTAQ